MDPALEALQQALAQYLAQGPNTPVAAEAQALMDTIQTQSGADPSAQGDPSMGQDPNAAPDPSMGSLSDMGGGGAPPPDAGADAMPPPQHDVKSFEGARAGAKDRLKKLNKKG